MFKTFALLAALLLSACLQSRGLNPIQNESKVELSENNFEVVRTGVRGEASVIRLLPYIFFPFTPGIPIGDPALSSRAMDELVTSGTTTGTSDRWGLINFSIDQTYNWFLLFSIETVELRADVVEFDR